MMMTEKFSFLKTRLPIFCFGMGLGIASQHIPELQVYSHGQEALFPCMPISCFHINRTGYSLAYDARNRNPAWVYEHLTAESIQGNAKRAQDFKEDPNIPNNLRATSTDCKGQGFDRGHMAPAGDHRSTSEAMNDTFYMTNICPQSPQLNRGYWSKLEKHVRDLTKQYANVYVVTGPLYLPHKEVDGKRYVKYQVIGKNDVAVPTHFFKVLTLDSGVGDAHTFAYILPNEAIPPKTPLENFETTIEKIEHLAGLILQ
ncbi:MAG: DNA/RNA non-specific endonuclease [Candidatus Protochlamydia sp.]|nr:DNA/RNA non-specific endonuclease [Candidatus Protochlamydia sp.]